MAERIPDDRRISRSRRQPSGNDREDRRDRYSDDQEPPQRVSDTTRPRNIRNVTSTHVSYENPIFEREEELSQLATSPQHYSLEINNRRPNQDPSGRTSSESLQPPAYNPPLPNPMNRPVAGLPSVQDPPSRAQFNLPVRPIPGLPSTQDPPSRAQFSVPARAQSRFESTLTGQVAKDFAKIPAFDHKACQRFFERTREVLDLEPDDFLPEAVAALRAQNLLYARNCVHQSLILRKCQAVRSSKAIKAFFEHLQDPEDKSVLRGLYGEFDKVLKIVQQSADKAKKVQQGPGDRSIPASLPVRLQTPRELQEGPRPNTLDPRYAPRNSHFFEIGKVIAMLWHEPAGASHDLKTDTHASKVDTMTTGPFGAEIFSHIKRFVVVSRKSTHGHSQCISINTYGGQGLRKAGFNDVDIAAHTIVYMEDTQPTALAKEPRSKKKPIRVRAASKAQKLHVASRLNYAKHYTIEHIWKVMHVGDIIGADLDRLIADYREVQDL